MKFHNKELFSVIYWGEQAYRTCGAQTPVHGGRSYLPVDAIFPPPVEDVIDNMGDEFNHDAEMKRPIPTSYPMTITGVQMVEMKLQRMVITKQRYLEVIRNGAFRLVADYEHIVVSCDDEAWLCEHDHIVNPPATPSVANRKCSGSLPAAD